MSIKYVMMKYQNEVVLCIINVVVGENQSDPVSIMLFNTTRDALSI